MKILDPPERRPLSSLRSHPEQAQIFGLPEEDPAFQEMVSSLRKLGQIEPILIKPNGTILAGHMRVAALTELKKPDVLCRVVETESYREEVELLIRTNTDRRQLTPEQTAHAYHKLRTLPKEEGGAAGKVGRPKKTEEKNGGQTPTISEKARDVAAQSLGISADEGRRLEAVFLPADVPEPVKAAVNAGQIAPSAAAEVIKTERKRQGGEIKDAAPLTAWAEEKAARKKPEAKQADPDESHPNDPDDHEKRVQQQAEAFRADMARLLTIYRDLSNMLARRPLKSVIGPTEHHEYAGLIRDISLCAWAEIESIQGQGQGGKQMRLAALDGGKK